MTSALRIKVIVGIAFAMASVVFIGFISVSTSKQLEDAQEYVKKAMIIKSKLHIVNLNLKNNVFNVRAFRRYNDFNLEQKDFGIESTKKSIEDLKAYVIEYEALNHQIQILENKANALFNFYESVDFEASRKSQLVEQGYFKQEIAIVNDINSQINTIDEYEDEILKQNEAAAESISQKSFALKIGGYIIIFIIVLVLSWVVSRELKFKVKAQRQLKKNLVKLDRNNKEIMLSNKVLEGAQGFLMSSQDINEKEVYLEQVFNKITTQLKVPFAILYYVDPNEKDQYYVRLAQGVKQKHHYNIRINEFPVQFLEHDSVKILKDIPNDFWHMETAMGSGLASEILFLALKDNHEILAILELGKLSAFEEHEIDMLKMIQHPVSVKLRSLIIQKSRDEIFDQLKTNQEILLNQQEELKTTNDELIYQTQVLQASEEELRAQEEELKQINEELGAKNDALESAKMVLDHKAEELKLSNQYKSEFLANMSHELRTPLNSILILSSLLKDNKKHNLNEKQLEYVSVINKSGNDLLKLINDILDLSKVESGKYDLLIEEFDICDLLDDIAQTFKIQAENKQIDFSIENLLPEKSLLRTDRHCLLHTLKNLLSNALKFTPENGFVKLLVKSANNEANNAQVLFEVIDNGIGLEESKLKMIFEPFKQANGTINRNYGGTGLGLSISKEFISLIEGQISGRNNADKGSTFSVLIPQFLETLEPIIDTPKDGFIEDSVEKVNDLSTLFNSEEGDKTILIIEDDAIFCKILTDFAYERGFKTIIAHDGLEGLDFAKKYIPDAIILDINLPSIDGWTILKKLKKNPQLSKIPVHIISGTENIQNQLDEQVVFLKKPVDNDILRKAFMDISGKLNKQSKHILFYNEDAHEAETLKQIRTFIPETIHIDEAQQMQTLQDLGAKQHYEVMVMALKDDFDKFYSQLEQIKSIKHFNDTAFILLINTKLSSADEAKLKGISQAVIMKSKDAYRRLIDELDLFLFKINESQKEQIEKRVNKFEVGDEDSFINNALQGKKILVVDDDMRNIFALMGLLQEYEIEVLTAYNGIEALEQLEAHEDIDLIMMDIMMPEMDGFEAMRRIRQMKSYQNAPIIAVTAKAMPEDNKLCIDAGASDYMSKPLDNNKLLSLIRMWISK